jgi:hypothetical protein
MRAPIVCLAAVLVTAAGCADDARSPAEVESFTVPVLADARAADARNFRAHARGDQEVPPVATRAQGQAVFHLSHDGTELGYRLMVANILDVTQSHIHLAPAGSNGGIAVWLYPSAPPAQLIPGRTQGVLGQGTITEADIVATGVDFEDLLDALRTGNAYVNVHTSAHPTGEIRGQIH